MGSEMERERENYMDGYYVISKSVEPYKLSQIVSTSDARIHSVVEYKLYQSQQHLHQPSYVWMYKLAETTYIRM